MLRIFCKASFIDEYTIEVTNNEEVRGNQADYFIIATGSSEKSFLSNMLI